MKHIREQLGISKATMARLVKEHQFKVYENPLGPRQKLADPQEVANAVLPHPVWMRPTAVIGIYCRPQNRDFYAGRDRDDYV